MKTGFLEKNKVKMTLVVILVELVALLLSIYKLDLSPEAKVSIIELAMTIIGATGAASIGIEGWLDRSAMTKDVVKSLNVDVTGSMIDPTIGE